MSRRHIPQTKPRQKKNLPFNRTTATLLHASSISPHKIPNTSTRELQPKQHPDPNGLASVHKRANRTSRAVSTVTTTSRNAPSSPATLPTHGALLDGRKARAAKIVGDDVLAGGRACACDTSVVGSRVCCREFSGS